MAREPDAEGGRELDPASDEFDAIVAGWLREGDVPTWPDEDRAADGPAPLFEATPTAPSGLAAVPPWPAPDGTAEAHEPGGSGERPDPGSDDRHESGDADRAVEPGYAEPPAWRGRGAAEEPVGSLADDHFIPPEPPPIPPLGPPALVGLALITLGLVLVVAPDLIGVPSTYGLPLGLLGLSAGLGWLVLRLWPDPVDDTGGEDDGAVL